MSSLSPIHSLLCGYIFLVVVIMTLYGFGFYDNSQYFQWGPPVIFFDNEIQSNTVFYLLICLIFLHELITNWIWEVVYPWVINNVQNPKITNLRYSKASCMMIVNANSLYSQLHLAFLVNGITSQISFLIALILADFITITIINWQYIKDKEFKPDEESPPQNTEATLTEIQIS